MELGEGMEAEYQPTEMFLKRSWGSPIASKIR